MCKENGSGVLATPAPEPELEGDDEKHERVMRWPEDRPVDGFSWLYQIYNVWTYSYMNLVLTKGKNQTLKDGTHLMQDDLYRVPDSMRSNLLSEKFRKHHGEGEGSQKRLLMTLWKIAAPTFIPAGFCQFLTVLCQVTLPLLVRELLGVLEDNPSMNVVKEGMPYAVGISVVLFVNGFGNHRQRHLALKSGVAMRASVVNIIYEHVLELSPQGRVGLTSGEVANLVAVDTQKLFEVAQEGHLIWSLPLSITLVTIALVVVLGPTTLVGIAVLIMFVPFIERITSRMLAIRQKRTKMTDKRVEIVSAMLQGIKVAKLNNYEANYEKRVTEARSKEVILLRQELAVWATTLCITVVSPMLASAATFTVYVLIDESNILTAAKTFAVLLLFSALRFPINYAGRLMGKAAQALSAVERITRFLNRELREEQPTSEYKRTEMPEASDESEGLGDADAPLRVANASFLLGGSPAALSSSGKETSEQRESGTVFKVSGVTISVKKGEVLAICGPVGCGKSTLINGIIDEVPAYPESVVLTKGRVSYVAQTPFILNTTLRANILFGLPFEEDVYERVLDACCLRQDIEQLGEFGDLVEIGERGVTLSGGQKQRVSLARAAYARPDLVLLDDPLSALDAGTAKLVFELLIRSRNAFFKDTAVVLVTHASHFLNRVDKVLVMVDGSSKFYGSWSELGSFIPSDKKTKGAIEFIQSAVQEGHILGDNEGAGESTARDTTSDKKEKKGSLITTEQREHGLSSLGTWLLWFKHAGGFFFLSLQVLFMTIDRLSYVAVEYWLARWTRGAEQSIEVFGIDFAPQADGLSAQYKYLTVYSLIILISVAATMLRSEWSVTGGTTAARNVFSSMLSSVLTAPMSYWDTTPMGRILNRFTYDMDVVDIVLTQNMSMLMISLSWYVAGVVVMCTILPWVGLALLPVTVLYWVLMLHYRKSGADLQRLDAVSRSPIQAMVNEGLDGCSTIRVFQQEPTFISKYRSMVDLNSSALLNFVSAQRWLGVRIEVIGSIVVLVSSVLVITLNESLGLDAGIIGLLILWSSNFTITLGFLVDTFAEAEAAITAIERVDAMSRLPSERPMETDTSRLLPPSWPGSGLLEFDKVCLRYREGLPLALNDLSFSIPPGKTCGVVGRTGAGKSSLTVALFRLVEIEAGRISLDGVDLSEIGLSDVRGRTNGMAIIPQDPFLTGNTLKECLDPFGSAKDSDIVEALQSVRLASTSDGAKVLETLVEEGGSNFSVGERQLLNLARALLSKPRLLILDEATASIDGETDAFVQEMLRTRFFDTTLVTVAHRLNTIMDYDLILVMDAGRAAEFGSPADLLKKKGLFTELVNATGPESAKALRDMVRTDH